MQILGWLGDHIVEGAGIVLGLFITLFSLQRETRTKRIENLSLITAQHRDIWRDFRSRPELRRTLSAEADLSTTPLTFEESLFVRDLVLHLNVAYRTIQNDPLSKPEGLEMDIRDFFSYPVPKAAWEKLKSYQDRDFVKFIEETFR